MVKLDLSLGGNDVQINKCDNHINKMKDKNHMIISTKAEKALKYPFTIETQQIGCRRDVALLQLLSCIQLFATSWTIAFQSPLASPVSQSLLKFMLS